MAVELKHDTVVLYHKNCLDGLAAAWCAWKHFKGQVDLISVQYNNNYQEMFGKEFQLLADKTVYVLDFSFDLETTKKMAWASRQYIMLDHHETAWKNLGKICDSDIDKTVITHMFDEETCLHPQLVLCVDQRFSGGMLAWKFFNHGKEPPYGILAAQDRDLWKWEVPGSREWTSAAFSFDFTVENFDALINRDPKEIVAEGKALMRNQERNVKILTKSPRRFKLNGYDVPIINANSFFASDAGSDMSKGEPFAIIYVDDGDGRIYSLRSQKCTTDVSKIAEQFGGGGHPNAAGFKISFDHPQFYHSHLELNSEERLKTLGLL